MHSAGRCSELTARTRNEAPHSAAAALASIVFPVPGGPKSRTPLQGAARTPLPCPNSSGCWSGSWTASRSASLAEFRAPTCSPRTFECGDEARFNARRGLKRRGCSVFALLVAQTLNPKP